MSLKYISSRDGEVGQQLRTYTALAEDPSLISSIVVRQLTLTCDTCSSSGVHTPCCQCFPIEATRVCVTDICSYSYHISKISCFKGTVPWYLIPLLVAHSHLLCSTHGSRLNFHVGTHHRNDCHALRLCFKAESWM